MGLLRNLKKRFNNWVDITLAELCSAYIKQLAKQTSKKRDNCSSMESLQNNLTMVHQDTIIAISSQDISEKITMDQVMTEDIVAHIRDWSIDKIEDATLVGDKIALYSEFEEWIEIEDEGDLEIVSMEGTNIDKWTNPEE